MNLADQLDTLQALQNEGRGVSCVRTIVTYLRRDQIESAKYVAMNEGDKIRNYPEIVKWLRENLVGSGYLMLGDIDTARK